MTPLLLILKGHQPNLEWKLPGDVRAIKMADTQLLLQFMRCIRFVCLADGLLRHVCRATASSVPLKPIHSALTDEFVLGLESEQNN